MTATIVGWRVVRGSPSRQAVAGPALADEILDTKPETHDPDESAFICRKSLAAGTLNNHIGTMAGWIAGAQDVKPGSKMPSSLAYSGVELRALSAWLGSLE